LLFENYGQEVGGPIHCWSPNLKVRGPVSPGPYGSCANVHKQPNPSIGAGSGPDWSAWLDSMYKRKWVCISTVPEH